MNKAKVVIVEDNNTWIELYRDILSTTTDIEVVGVAYNEIEAMEVIRKTKPDIILLDINLHPEIQGLDQHGFEVIEKVKYDSPKSKIIVVTGGNLKLSKLLGTSVVDVIIKGATGNDFVSVLLKTIYKAIRGEQKTLNEAKLIVTGQSAVGKTSLVLQILRQIFDSEQPKTEGIAISQWQIETEQKTRVNIWDFGGQEIMTSLQ